MSEVLPHVILVLGPGGLREQEINRLERLILGCDQTSWNTHKYYADTFSPQDFLEQAQTRPFFGLRQILRIRRTSGLSKGDQETISRYLQTGTSFTWVILEDEGLAANTVLFHQVAKRGRVIRLEVPSGDQRAAWLKERLKEEGVELPKEAIEVMIDRSGENLMALEQAATKVALMLKGMQKKSRKGGRGEDEGESFEASEELTIGEILSLVDDSVEYDTFDLVEAISRKDTKKALEIFHLLYERKSFSFPEILGVLNWHFKRLWQCKRLAGEGLPPREIMKRLHIPYGVFQRLRGAAQELGPEGLEGILEDLFQLDWGIKQGNVEERIGLETFLVTTCLPSEAGTPLRPG